MNHLNPIARAAAALTVIAATAACAAQPVPRALDSAPMAPPAPRSAAPMPPPAPAADAPMPPPPPLAGPRDGVPTTVSGVVRRFVINPEGDVDGMLLADNTLVRFPPHLGTQVAATIEPGASVNVNGFAQASGTLRAGQIADTKSGRSIVDQPPPPDAQRLPKSLAGVGLVKLDAAGRVLRVTSAPRGEPDGVLLIDGTVIKLTPAAAARFTNLMQPGAMVAAQGYGTRNRYGESLQATAFGTPGNLTVLYGDLPR
ncbi:hypothetical protein P0D71_31485 [Paraburkholderia sp. RL17-383-BIF-A]|uniref:hypothetical protein n=1 Tax=Paraburkholderia sp. RL17-383-BIF-A TaxID=3031631 RepID=UPI0038BB9CE2